MYPGHLASPDEKDACDTGRIVIGACGAKPRENDHAAGTDASKYELEASTTIENGHGKCMVVDEHVTKGCGGKGAKIVNTIEKNGKPAGPMIALGEEDTTTTIDKGATTCPYVDVTL